MNKEYRDVLNNTYLHHFHIPSTISKDKIILFSGFEDSFKYLIKVVDGKYTEPVGGQFNLNSNMISIIESEGTITSYTLDKNDYYPNIHGKSVTEQFEILTRRIKEREPERIESYNYYADIKERK